MVGRYATTAAGARNDADLAPGKVPALRVVELTKDLGETLVAGQGMLSRPGVGVGQAVAGPARPTCGSRPRAASGSGAMSVAAGRLRP